jgi:hypothetical protein
MILYPRAGSDNMTEIRYIYIKNTNMNMKKGYSNSRFVLTLFVHSEKRKFPILFS